MSSTAAPYPYRNIRFRLSIDGINIAGFNSVTIPESSADAIEYREGDQPPYLGKQPGLIKFTNVILKKGMTQSQDLHKWFNDVKNGKLERKKAIIFLDDFAGKEAKKWVCSNCWPVKYTIAELNAQGNQVLIENLELANEGVELQP